MIFFLSILSEQYRKFHRLSGVIFLSLFLFQASFPVEIEAAKKKKSSKVTINLPQTLILKEFIKIISEHTGTVFVYEEKNMRGQMSITAPRNFKVSAEDAFYFFEKILASQGLAMVRKKGSKVVEILTAADARFSRLPISKDGGKVGELCHASYSNSSRRPERDSVNITANFFKDRSTACLRTDEHFDCN